MLTDTFFSITVVYYPGILQGRGNKIFMGMNSVLPPDIVVKEMEEVVFPHPTVSEIFKETIFAF